MNEVKRATTRHTATQPILDERGLVSCLPKELQLKIFAMFDNPTLLQTIQVNQDWKNLTLISVTSDKVSHFKKFICFLDEKLPNLLPSGFDYDTFKARLLSSLENPEIEASVGVGKTRRLVVDGFLNILKELDLTILKSLKKQCSDSPLFNSIIDLADQYQTYDLLVTPLPASCSRNDIHFLLHENNNIVAAQIAVKMSNLGCFTKASEAAELITDEDQKLRVKLSLTVPIVANSIRKQS